MKYYLHDSNAFNDEKVTELFVKFGYEGLGLFYTILEKLAAQEKPIKTVVLKHQLKVGKKLDKCWSFMESLGIISSNNGETFNKQLLNFSEKYQIKKEKNKEKIAQWRENQLNTENVTSYEPVCNRTKDNISKVKESKDINTAPDGAQTFCFEKSLLNYGFEKQLVSDWLKVRKTKKATNTETALNTILETFEKLELTGRKKNDILRIMVEQSWSGLKVSWIENLENDFKNNAPVHKLSGMAITPKEDWQIGMTFDNSK